MSIQKKKLSEMENEFSMKFGERLKKIRLDLGLSQKDFCAPAGLTQNVYTNIECGKSGLSLGKLNKILVAFDKVGDAYKLFGF